MPSERRAANSMIHLDTNFLIQALVPNSQAEAKTHKAAELFNATGRRSRSLADCPFAAVALRCNARIATGDASDFTPFESHGLAHA
jgi:predicted nucleic acid-binding protein